MLTASDWTQMAADLAAVRDDNATSVTLRRAGTTLSAQSVRIARRSAQASVTAGSELEQSQQSVVVLGPTTLNIQPGDRFNDGNMVYEVVAVRPNRRAGIMAEATAVL